jgi:hypothetical protein
MEVHHHPNVEKKNLKEYFLEFLMIFLAVTMGFFAESLREHIVNIDKEKEFVLSLKEDLATNTSFLLDVIPENQLQFDKLDSLYTLLELAQEGKPFSMNRLYYLNFRYAEGLVYFSANTRTITQIKNTGAFSLIRNKECRDSITEYVNVNEIVIPVNVEGLKEWTNDLNKMSQKIFDFKLIKTFWFSGGADIFLKDSLHLEITSDKSLLKEYANKVRSLMMMVNVLENSEKSQLERCKALIALLNKEYKLAV